MSVITGENKKNRKRKDPLWGSGVQTMSFLELQPTQDTLINSLINDSIGRTKDIVRFSHYINDLDTSFSIAIDSGWGSGKTFFIKQTKLVLDAYNDYGIQTISEEERTNIRNCVSRIKLTGNQSSEFEPQVCVYYDAWANDNDSDPLLSLVYEILKSVHADFSFKEGKNIFEISAAIIEFFTGKSANDLIAAFRSSSPFDGITTQRNLHELINEFLSELLKERGNRLVVFVDELDRCKPDYAVRLLERVKHYFSDDHIVFVFSINCDALQHTIRRYYGDDFDATRYLDRFFDITMELPPYDENLFFNSIGLYDSSYIFDHFRKNIVRRYHLSMREMIRYYKITSIIAHNYTHTFGRGFAEDNAYTISLLFILPVAVILRMTDRDAYSAFISGKNSNPILEAADLEIGRSVWGMLLNSDETFDVKNPKNMKVVSLTDKIEEVYEALFSNPLSSRQREVYIGDTCFNRETRDRFLRTLSAMSDEADYSF